ncbi:MAG: dihydrofolate reductase [Clostridia bacterium]|jgi:dihydrofolate reductase|nr:dihydrofolate reductase [Clostridia bacterium]
MLSIIVAVSENNVIGKDNKLLWHIPEDLKRFKEITTGKTIIMGRKTFESLGRVLPNRKHIILTRSLDFKVDNENVEIINNKEDISKYRDSKEEAFIIGGGIIYTQFMELASKIYITKIHKRFEGDTYFPKIDEDKWEEIQRQKGIKNTENPYDYEYITYIRKQ